jgi:hypothetical protein
MQKTNLLNKLRTTVNRYKNRVRNSWRKGGDTTQLKETILKTNENITEKLKLQALQISVSS